MTTAIIVQARMTSTRLPGKILAPVLGKPLLAYQLERLGRVRLADEFVVATTTEPTDDPVGDLARSMGWHVTRGSEDDVLARYWQAAKEVQADLIIRSTADCPLIDPALIDDGIRNHFELGGDYTTGLGLADGMGFEVFTATTLETLARDYWEPETREHVTFSIYTHPERFNCRGYEVIPDRSKLRWTVDTAEDLVVIRHILETLYPDNPRFTVDDVAALMEQHPEWVAINAEVEQRYAQQNTDLYKHLRKVTGKEPANPWLAR